VRRAEPIEEYGWNSTPEGRERWRKHAEKVMGVTSGAKDPDWLEKTPLWQKIQRMRDAGHFNGLSREFLLNATYVHYCGLPPGWMPGRHIDRRRDRRVHR